MSDKLQNFSFKLKGKELLPLVSGGMGVNISTESLARVAAKLGTVGHISDAMTPFLSDTLFGSRYQSDKGKLFKNFRGKTIKEGLKWGYDVTHRATKDFVRSTMDKKVGNGQIWVNMMEKLTMGNPKETLKARLMGAMDGGIEGITLSAGLHTGTLALAQEHPRFRDVNFGIITSSLRALKIFLRSATRVNRMPDYVVVEGPLAGGHLGFGEDWKRYDLKKIVSEIINFMKSQNLDIPIIPAGGVFTGQDACEYVRMGAAAVQVATRLTISQECGMPFKAKQEYLKANEEDIVVNTTSPTGYLMRMLKSSPSLSSNQRPNCESLGYILDSAGKCAYLDAYEATGLDESGKKLPVKDKMCICTHFMNYTCYTCGHYAYRLKDTTVKVKNGLYYIPKAEHIMRDYLESSDHEISLPEPVGLNGLYEKTAKELGLRNSSEESQSALI